MRPVQPAARSRRTSALWTLALGLALGGCADASQADDDLGDLEDIDWLDGSNWEDDASDEGEASMDAPAEASRADAGRDGADASEVARDAAEGGSADATPEAGPDAAPDAGGFDFPTPIHHVLVLIRENRTFDNMFTGFPNAETTTFGVRSNGSHVPLRRAPDGDLAGDIRHNHAGATMAYAGGRMNGFDRNADRYSDTGDPLGPFLHYTESQIPSYWAYARRYVLFDNFFSTTLTQSSPGHLTFWTAQVPIIDNPDCPGTACANGGGCFARGATVHPLNQDTCATPNSTVAPCFDIPSVVDDFPAQLTWRIYASANENNIVTGPLSMVRDLTRNRTEFLSHTAPTSSLIQDLRTGHQANLIMVHVGGAAGEHPPHGLCAGENFVVQVLNAVMRGPHWRTTAVLLTYDDWGGFYDHVAPPQDRCSNGDHMHLGFRLPLILVSPYARRSTSDADPYVFHGRSEQSSIPRLVEDLFRLPRMNARDRHARDARAGSLRGAFDFANPDFTPLLRSTRTCP